MNCSSVEKLIPLYVEDDLEAHERPAVEAHLNSCASCSQLACEYTESQNWVRSYEAPQFDEAFFDDLRASVLGQINAQASRPSRLRTLARNLSRRHAFAAIAVILLFGLAAFLLFDKAAKRAKQPGEIAAAPTHQAEPDAKSHTDEKATEAPRNNSLEQVTNDQVADSSTRRRKKAVERNRIERARLARAAERQSEPRQQFAKQIEPIASNLAAAHQASGEQPASDAMMEASMTRIEIQTSDPNIRIIWFAPKPVDSQLRP